MTAELDIPHLQQHADILSSLQGPEKLRLAILRAGGHGVKKAVRHALLLMSKHAHKLAESQALHPDEADHLRSMHQHYLSAPQHVRSVIDRFVSEGPLGNAGGHWRDIVNSHKEQVGGSWWRKAWHGFKRGVTHAAKAVGHVLKPVGDFALKEAQKIGESLLKQAEKDPIGTAQKIGAAVA